MASNDVETAREDSEFDFDKWIVRNKLGEIKSYFVKHNMITISTLTTQSKEFSSFIADQTLLMKKSQFIPKVFTAIQTLQTQHMNNNERIIVISEKENKILNNMKSDLKHLDNLEIQINELTTQSFQTQSRLKATKNSQIEDAKKQIKNITNNLIHALQAKEKQILNKLNSLVEIERKCDDDLEHPILAQTMNLLSETKQSLLDSMKQCNDYIHSTEHQNIDERKNIICDINDKAIATFKTFECLSKKDVLRVQNQINYDEKLCRQMLVNVDINQNVYAQIMDDFNKFSAVKMNNYLPLKASDIEVAMNKKRLWNEMTKEKYTILMNWLKENGANFANFKQKGLNGIFSNTEGKKGMVFATIPPKCIMTMEKAKESPIGQKLMKKEKSVHSEHVWIAAYLLVEKKKGCDSFWFPFIDMLPTQFNTVPIYFSEDEIKQLKGSITIKKIESRLNVWHQQYDSLKDVFESENIPFEDFVWSRLVTITRIFGMTINDHKTSGLVPFADLLDHKKKKNVRWTYDNNQSAFIVQANDKIQIGDELFVTYGTKCNSRFFVNYGFILASKNEANEAIVSLNVCQLSMSDQELDVKKARKLNSLLQFSKFSQVGYDIFFPIGHKYKTENTLSLFGMARLMSCDEKEMNKTENVKSLEEIVPLSASNEEKALKLISQAAQSALNQFDTTLHEDAQLLKSKTKSMNERNIILMRMGEKEVLDIYVKLYALFMKRNSLYIHIRNISLHGYLETVSEL